jgi:hypothetical protein
MSPIIDVPSHSVPVLPHSIFTKGRNVGVLAKIRPKGPRESKEVSGVIVVIKSQHEHSTSVKSHSPALPIPAQKPEHLPLAHGILARKLQHASAGESLVSLRELGVGGEFEADAVGQFLPVEIWSVGSFEVRQVEFLAWAGLLV